MASCLNGFMAVHQPRLRRSTSAQQINRLCLFSRCEAARGSWRIFLFSIQHHCSSITVTLLCKLERSTRVRPELERRAGQVIGRIYLSKQTLQNIFDITVAAITEATRAVLTTRSYAQISSQDLFNDPVRRTLSHTDHGPSKYLPHDSDTFERAAFP
jgi:hypothetical protein